MARPRGNPGAGAGPSSPGPCVHSLQSFQDPKIEINKLMAISRSWGLRVPSFKAIQIKGVKFDK